MDAGPVWAAETFPMRAATKSSLYRSEVTEAAARAVVAAVRRFAESVGPVGPGGPAEPGGPEPGGAGQRRSGSGQLARREPAAARNRRRARALAPADAAGRCAASTGRATTRSRCCAGSARPTARPACSTRLFDTPCHLFDAHRRGAGAAARSRKRDRPAARGDPARDARRRGVDRARAPRRPARRLQAAYRAGLSGAGGAASRVAGRIRRTQPPLDDGWRADRLRIARRCRLPALSVLQRRNEHRAVPAADRRACGPRWTAGRACWCCWAAPTSGRTAST